MHDKQELGPDRFHVTDHRGSLYEYWQDATGNVKTSDEQKERSYQVMTSWDELHGRGAAGSARRRHLRRLIVLAEPANIDNGFGIPAARDPADGRQSLTTLVAPSGDAAKHIRLAAADFVYWFAKSACVNLQSHSFRTPNE